jgi:hypothetical protein
MAMDSAATQVGVDGPGPGVGTFPVDKGVDTVVVGGRVGVRVLDPVPLAISGQAGTKEAPPCPYKYASHLHPMLKYLVSENVPINSIHKKVTRQCRCYDPPVSDACRHDDGCWSDCGKCNVWI